MTIEVSPICVRSFSVHPLQSLHFEILIWLLYECFIVPLTRTLYPEVCLCPVNLYSAVYGVFAVVSSLIVVCRLKRGKPIEPGKDAEGKDKEV